MEFTKCSGYGWLVVGAATGLTFLYGIFFSFGIFLDPLITEFHWSSALTSLVFSLYSVSYGLSTILVGRMSDRYGSTTTIGLGGFVITLALALSSRVDSVWQLYLTFGVMGGLGAAVLWVPPTKVVMEYFQFSSNLNLAVSITSTGTGIGMLLISPLAGFFIVEYGWRVCYLLFSLISVPVCVFAVLVMRNTRSANDGVGEETGLPGPGLRLATKTRTFWSLFSMYALGFGVARYTVMVYLVVFLIAVGFPLQMGAACLSLVGGGSILGRIISGYLSKWVRENKIVCASFLLQGLATFALILPGNAWVISSSALVFGIAYGGYVPQFPILTRDSFGMKSYGLIFGAISSGLGLGALIGPPILGGYSFSATGNYLLTFVLSGVFALVAGVTALFIKSSN